MLRPKLTFFKITYPSGRQVQHGYDAADRLTSVVSGMISVAIPKYHPQGTPEEMEYGNGVKETWTLNKRLQVQGISVTKGAASLLGLTYEYGNNTGANNNENVTKQTIAAGGHTFAQSYVYDELNRLKQMTEATSVAGATAMNLNFQYDRYGNLAAGAWNIAIPGAMATSLNQYNAATNRRDRDTNGTLLSTNPYDAMGNVVTDAVLGAMKYDQAGRLRETQVAGKTITYDYDAEGRRVKRHYAGLGTTYYVYDGSGQLAAEYGASEPMLCQRCYLSADALGSTRLMTDDAGTVKQRTDYLPFGDVIMASQTQGGGRQAVLDGGQMMYTLAGGATQKFTGKERDAETGLDYFGARYLASGRGRWLAADAPFADQFEGNPQSWNLFTYVRNNPVAFADPDGFRTDECGFSFGLYGSCSGHGGQSGSEPMIGPIPMSSGDEGVVQRVGNAGIGWVKQNLSDIINLLGGDNPTQSTRDLLWYLRPSNRRQEAGANASLVSGVFLLPGLVKKLTKDAIGLRKQLASEAQVAELSHGGGRVIIGAGSGTELRDASRLATQYGGAPTDWAKISSASHTARDGTVFEIHAYRNVKTGSTVEMKTVINKRGNQ